MTAEIGILAGITVVKWLVYTALLWGMIKVQKMQYNLLGLLGSSALATLINFIPVVGCYLSWAVLVLCLWKVTHSDIVPDVLFTVGIAGAIMFCLNLWAFAALMGDLRPGLQADSEDAGPAFAEIVEEDDAPAKPVAAPKPAPEPSRQSGSSPVGKLTDSVSRLIRSATPGPAPATSNLSHGLVLKGVVLQASQPSAMLMAGNKYYTIQAGEELVIPAANTNLKVRCNSIDRSLVSLTLNNAHELSLRVR
jgi:hypothetical protein